MHSDQTLKADSSVAQGRVKQDPALAITSETPWNMEGPSGLFDFNDETDELLDTRVPEAAETALSEQEVTATPPCLPEPPAVRETCEGGKEASEASESGLDDSDDDGPCPVAADPPEAEQACSAPGPRRRPSIEEIVKGAKLAAKFMPGTSDGVAEDEVLCSDERGYVRGACKACSHCPLFALSHHMEVCWWRTPGGATQQGALQELGTCQRCGCRAEDHADCTRWLVDARNSMRRFRATHINTTRPLPQRGRVPAAALAWQPADVALHALTLGQFEPRTALRVAKVRDLLPEGAEGLECGSTACRGALVSVCVPTTERRKVFNTLVYKNFIAQTYEPKELIIIETGKQPSSYFQDRSLVDPRVIYRFFPVEDATEDTGESTGQTLMFRPGVGGHSNSFQPREVESNLKGIPRSWALGMKRNIACHLARGEIVAHFDDDDLYSSDYLANMVDHLQAAVDRASAKKGEQSRRLPPAIATLSQWHMVDMPAMTFRFMDPKNDPDMRPEWVEPMIYGYGFSYVFTKAAWDLQAFPDTQTCEDDIFMRGLREKQVPVELVQLPKIDSGKGGRGGELEREGYVAHVLHPDCTSGGEFNGKKRLGPLVPTPAAFRERLEIATWVSRHLPRRIAGVPLWPATATSQRRQSNPLELRKPTPATKGGKAVGRGIAGRGFQVTTSPSMTLRRDAAPWARATPQPPLFGDMRARRGSA